MENSANCKQNGGACVCESSFVRSCRSTLVVNSNDSSSSSASTAFAVQHRAESMTMMMSDSMHWIGVALGVAIVFALLMSCIASLLCQCQSSSPPDSRRRRRNAADNAAHLLTTSCIQLCLDFIENSFFKKSNQIKYFRFSSYRIERDNRC